MKTNESNTSENIMLSIQNFSKVYKGEKKAVKNLRLSINSGDIYGFVGHNGAGKTTTIKSIVGILNFEEGEIFVNGYSIRKEPLICKSILAYIPDNPDLYEHLTGIQYLNFISDIFSISKSDRELRIRQYAEIFEIQGALGNLISSYSHGMKQKLAIISAFIRKPKLLILDEPFVGLDPNATLQLKNMMYRICDEGGAIFFSTHVLDVAEKLCNKIAIIKSGELIACGKTEDLIQDSTLESFFMEAMSNEK